jgi:hypothetical protein
MTLINAFFFLMLLAMAGIIWLILDGWWGFEQQSQQTYSQLISRIHKQQVVSSAGDSLVLNLGENPLPGICDDQGFFLVAKAEASTLPARQTSDVRASGKNKDAA